MDTTNEKNTDVVCGMHVDPATAKHSSTHQEQTYYFCSSSCKDTFDKNPEQYSKSADKHTGHSTPGCCH